MQILLGNKYIHRIKVYMQKYFSKIRLLFVLFSFFLSPNFTLAAHSFQEVVSQKKGKVVVHWYYSKPFINENKKGEVEGIEVDLIVGFQKWLKNKGIELEIEWRRSKNFVEIFEILKKGNPNDWAVSAISITEERKELIDFSSPYLSDITVLISNNSVPVVNSEKHFLNVFSKIKAISIKGTTYEKDLMNLQKNQNLQFEIQFISSKENILETVEKTPNSFAFIDLPIYLMKFNQDPSFKVQRQNFYPVKREGHAIAFVKNSDWTIPFNQYLREIDSLKIVKETISKYINLDVYDFMSGLTKDENENEKLLAKEKELQYLNLVESLKVIERQNQRKNYLFLIIIFFGIISIAGFFINWKRKKLNENLNQQNQKLISLNEEKNNLIKILAHDLRTPVNHIKGLSDLIQNNSNLDSDSKNYVEIINSSAERINKMITNILDIDALENHKMNIKKSKIDLIKLLKNVIESFEETAIKKNIKIILNYTESSIEIVNDALMLTQIFDNLISNAIKFSPKGYEVSVVVEIKEKIEVSIIDKGPGFSEDDLKMLFKKFQRLSASPTDGERSTGLGLSIVKKYAELIQAEIYCQSKKGEGATFIVRL